MVLPRSCARARPSGPPMPLSPVLELLPSVPPAPGSLQKSISFIFGMQILPGFWEVISGFRHDSGAPKRGLNSPLSEDVSLQDCENTYKKPHLAPGFPSRQVGSEPLSLCWIWIRMDPALLSSGVVGYGIFNIKSLSQSCRVRNSASSGLENHVFDLLSMLQDSSFRIFLGGFLFPGKHRCRLEQWEGFCLDRFCRLWGVFGVIQSSKKFGKRSCSMETSLKFLGFMEAT